MPLLTLGNRVRRIGASTLSSFTPDSPHAAQAARAGTRGVVIFERQSSIRQVDHNIGSQILQEDYAEQVMTTLEVLGVSRTKMHVAIAAAESGSAGKPRDVFDQVYELVVGYLVGLVAIAMSDRLGRNMADAERLFDAAARRGVIFLVGAKTLDPSDAEERHALQKFASDAQLDVQRGVQWRASTQFAQADRLALAIPLPAPLLWVPNRDPLYWQRAQAAGLHEFLRACPKGHRTQVQDRFGNALYILPYPDRAVVDACRMSLRWLLTTRSLAETCELIRDGADDYPNPGLFPRFRTMHWHSLLTPSWREVSTTMLQGWSTNRALAGVYSYYAQSLVRLPVREERAKRSKGAHFGRARSQQQPPLPTALQLLRTA